MTKYKLEYIWLDGYEPVPNLRSKTKIVDIPNFRSFERTPLVGLRWQLDASGRRQNSDCMLKPVAVYPDSTRKNGAAGDVRSLTCPT